tara:strand:+ start:964 stop:1167 length:204 start_codon:yes stop_codon:yes gene_type:complete
MRTEELEQLPRGDTIRQHATNYHLRMYRDAYLDRTVSKELARRKLFMQFREKGYSYDKADRLSRKVL